MVKTSIRRDGTASMWAVLVIMISDFVMASIPELLVEKAKLLKANGNNFYSISVGNHMLKNNLKSVLNNEWVYNHDNSSVHSLHSMVRAIPA